MKIPIWIKYIFTLLGITVAINRNFGNCNYQRLWWREWPPLLSSFLKQQAARGRMATTSTAVTLQTIQEPWEAKLPLMGKTWSEARWSSGKSSPSHLPYHHLQLAQLAARAEGELLLPFQLHVEEVFSFSKWKKGILQRCSLLALYPSLFKIFIMKLEMLNLSLPNNLLKKTSRIQLLYDASGNAQP